MRVFILLSVLFYMVTANFSYATQALKSHRAIYDLVLGNAESGSGIESLSGRIVHEWTRQCDGNVLNQATLMVLQNSQGGSVATQDETSLWESRDGKKFRFFSEHKINGKLENRNSGKATIRQDGSGSVEYREPKKRNIDLPKGVSFPSALTIEAIEKALAGDKFFNRTMFDGTDKDGAYRTTVFFGKSFSGKKNYAKFPGLLSNVIGWTIRVAYFKYGKIQATPEVEIKMDLFRNGIAGNMEFDYGQFSVSARLMQLHSVDEPKC